MSNRITRVTCALALDRYCRMSGQRSYWDDEHPWDGTLVLHDESGVKRICKGVNTFALREIGPGFLTWRELYGFIQGLIAAEELAEERQSHEVPA